MMVKSRDLALLARPFSHHQVARSETGGGVPQAREATRGGSCGQVGNVKGKGRASLDGGRTTRMHSCC